MGNSTVQLQSIVDFAKTMPDLNSTLSVGGMSQQPALTIANDVMTAMLAESGPWKFNRFKIPPFYTNSLQQDYASAGLTAINNLAWLENGVSVNINDTAEPKERMNMEVVRDLPETSVQYGNPGQVSWLPNDQLIYGTWGGGLAGEGSQMNPGPGSIYGQILGVPATIFNPMTQIKDPNGNLWILLPTASNNLTAAITLGNTQPVWPTNPVYPTFTNPSVVATTITDGGGTWTAINPKGQGFRLNPIPPQTGIIWQERLFGQARPVQFTSLQQTIDPIPDDFAPYFRRGFIAYSYMHCKDPKIAAKFAIQQKLWIESLATALRSIDREKDNSGIYPSEPTMQGGVPTYIGPANPFYPSGF